MADLHKHFKVRGIEAHEDFGRYSHQFRHLLGLRSEKALDLFNQLVSIKEVGELNPFVRDHMLEKANAQIQLAELLANFENLTRVHDTMLRARQQLSILEPLIEEADQFADRQVRQRFAQRCADLVPTYIAGRKKTMLEDAIETAQRELDLQKQQRLLRASANHLADFECQKEQVATSRAEAQRELDGVKDIITTLGNIMSDYWRQHNECIVLLQGVSPADQVDLVTRIERDLQGIQITLETIAAVQEERRHAYNASVSSLQSLQEKLRESIVRRKMVFKEHSPTISQDVDASLEAVDEYRRLYERICRDDLPSHQACFKELLNAKVILSISLFKAGLEREEGEIKESTARLNEQLRAINYTPMAYIQLCHEPTSDSEVQFFRQALRACIPDTGQPEDDPAANEVSFQRIAVLIERFKSDVRAAVWAA